MFVHTGSDIMRYIMEILPYTPRQSVGMSLMSKKLKVDIDGINEQLEVCNRLRKYANSQFERVGKVFSCVPPYISGDLEFFRHKPKIMI